MADETVQPDPRDAAASPAEDERLLQQARQLLDRGDYGRVLRLLEPLAERHGAATRFGAELRLLQATALFGQGRAEDAAACCRALRGCADPGLRAMARELLQVLEAPALQRPRDWSLSLPDLGGGAPLESLGGAMGAGRRRRRPVPPPPPPVGPTRPPYGFAALVGVLLVLLLLSSLLGGCVEVHTDLRFAGPGRLQVSQELRSPSGVPGPWQQRLTALLSREGYRSRSVGAATRLEGPVQPAQMALQGLSESFREAARLADLPLPPPRIELRERNWLLGVRQRLSLDVDLRNLPTLPGLSLTLDLDPVRSGAIAQASPNRPEPVGAWRQRWALRPGSINTLVVQSWRWSPLGLGAALIAPLPPLVLALQQLRRRLGFGLPELPA